MYPEGEKARRLGQRRDDPDAARFEVFHLGPEIRI
jgi:hypothetical protein